MDSRSFLSKMRFLDILSQITFNLVEKGSATQQFALLATSLDSSIVDFFFFSFFLFAAVIGLQRDGQILPLSSHV